MALTQEDLLICPCHGKPFKNVAGYKAHLRAQEPVVEPPVVEPPVEVLAPPAALERDTNKHWLAGANDRNLRGGILRTIKMMRPVCKTCQAVPHPLPEWWKSCTHGPYGDPYYTFSKMSEDTFEVLTDEQGRVRATPGKAEEWFEPAPNIVQVPLSERVGNSNADATLPQKRRAMRGYILPEEHPTHPRSPYCEYRGCFSQNVKQYDNGQYCTELEAKLIRLCEEEGTTIEVHNQRVRRKQLAGVNVR